MKKIVVLIIITCCIASYILFRGYADCNLIRKGNEIILRIESFQFKEKRLPNSLAEIGIEGEDELFYNKYDSVHYMIWYGTSLGESVTYYSDSKKWETGERGFKN